MVHKSKPEAWITLKATPGAQATTGCPGPNDRHDSNVKIETWEGDGPVAVFQIWIVLEEHLCRVCGYVSYA